MAFGGSGSSGGVDFKVHEVWVLSPDKGNITIARHFSSARDNADQTVVLAKQLAAALVAGIGGSRRTD